VFTKTSQCWETTVTFSTSNAVMDHSHQLDVVITRVFVHVILQQIMLSYLVQVA